MQVSANSGAIARVRTGFTHSKRKVAQIETMIHAVNDRDVTHGTGPPERLTYSSSPLHPLQFRLPASPNTESIALNTPDYATHFWTEHHPERQFVDESKRD